MSVFGKGAQWRIGVFFLLLLAACQTGQVEVRPPEIVYGQDVCSRCGMIIGEARFAAAAQLQSGEYLLFDDAGEMLTELDEYTANLGQVVLAAWVHDYHSEEWIDIHKAIYVKSATLSTPMGSGIACFSDEAQAQQFAAEQGGKLYSLEEIKMVPHSHSMGG
jgi:copper chaperone NosL